MRWARWMRALIDRAVHYGVPIAERERILTELHDEFEATVFGKGARVRAVAWYLREGMSLVWWYQRARMRRVLRGRGREVRHALVPRGRRAGGAGDLVYDLRLAWRAVVRRRGLSAVAVAILALGIGAGSTILTGVRALTRGLPVPDADRLVRVFRIARDDTEAEATFSFPAFERYARDARTLSGLAAFTSSTTALRLGTYREDALTEHVSVGFFETLGVEPHRGRFFRAEETAVGGPVVAVVSHALWTRLRPVADPLLGHVVRLNDQPFTIVGVTPPGFRGTSFAFATDVWVSLSTRHLVSSAALGWHTAFEDRSVRLLGRLGRDANVARAAADLNAIHRGLSIERGRAEGETRLRVLPERVGAINPDVPDALRAAALVSFGLVALVVLVACANVGSLLVADAYERRAEVAVRMALGASRWRVGRQMLLEVAVLTGAAGVLGAVVTRLAASLYTAFLPPLSTPLTVDFTPDAGVAALGIAIAGLTVLGAGAVPAIRAMRTPPALTLVAGGARGTTGGRAHGRTLDLLLGVQAASTVVILVMAAFLTRTMLWYESVDPGFAVEDRLIATVDVEQGDYTRAEGQRFFEELVAEVGAIPGVQGVSLAAVWPLQPGSPTASVSVPRAAAEPTVEDAAFNRVVPGYFEAMQIQLRRGRVLAASDGAGAAPVAVINESMARRFFGDGDPVGRRFTRAGDAVAITVVGVVEDVRDACIACDPRPYFYLPFAQSYQARMTLHVVAPRPLTVAPHVREIVTRLDRRLGVRSVMTVAQWVGTDLWLARTAATMVGGLGLLVLVCASAGLYGVVAFLMMRRTREIGIRIALGARPSGVVKQMVVRRLALVGTATLLGLLLAVVVAFSSASLFFGVSPADPTTYLAVIVLMLLASGTAAIVPARRASRMDPSAALRE